MTLRKIKKKYFFIENLKQFQSFDCKQPHKKNKDSRLGDKDGIKSKINSWKKKLFEIYLNFRIQKSLSLNLVLKLISL